MKWLRSEYCLPFNLVCIISQHYFSFICKLHVLPECKAIPTGKNELEIFWINLMFIVVSLVPFGPWSPIYCIYKKNKFTIKKMYKKCILSYWNNFQYKKLYNISQMKNEPHKEAQMESDLLWWIFNTLLWGIQGRQGLSAETDKATGHKVNTKSFAMKDNWFLNLHLAVFWYCIRIHDGWRQKYRRQ